MRERERGGGGEGVKERERANVREWRTDDCISLVFLSLT